MNTLEVCRVDKESCGLLERWLLENQVAMLTMIWFVLRIMLAEVSPEVEVRNLYIRKVCGQRHDEIVVVSRMLCRNVDTTRNEIRYK